MATTLLQNLIAQPFWKNPVVVRDMRVRLRGSRAFWNQAFYLGLLCIIALLGYGLSVRFGTDRAIDPVAVQSALQGFYYTVFVTVAILISLIAPGLTAVSIIFERQRLTLDLLVTTPMTSMQMLVGKLVSSIAFIILLLVLSIPISALCVILGGATIGDVLQTYTLLAIDGIVLAAIGLAFSCSSKQNVQAIVGTYCAIIIYMFVTFSAGASSLAGFMGGRGSGASAPMPAIASVLYLNPIITIAAPGHGISILGLTVPVWLATGVAAFLFVRLILTGAALRLGLYGGGLVASLRRQVLLCTAIVIFLIAQSVLSLSVGFTPGAAQAGIVVIICSIFGLATFFLPGLFVPVTDEDAPQGTEVRGSYDVRSAFTARHSGALPFFHLWLLTVVVFAVLGGWAGAGAPSVSLFARHAAGTPPGGVTANIPALVRAMAVGGAAAFFYCSGLGFLLWSLARRAATLAGSFTAARPLSFLLYVFVIGLPLAILAVMAQISSSSDVFSTSPLRFLSLGYAFTSLASSSGSLNGFWERGALAYFYGVIAYPFWQSVTPGGGALFNKPALSPAAAARIAGGGS